MLSDNNLLIGDFPKDSEIHANCLGMSSSRPLYTAPEKSESLLAYFGKRGHGEVSRYCFVFKRDYFWFLLADLYTRSSSPE